MRLVEDWDTKSMHFTFTRTWQVRQPVVFRFMEEKFVDEFLQHGKLRLASTQQFKKHSDEARNDDEGVGITTAISDHSTLVSVHRTGRSSYILCGSLSTDDSVTKAFGRKGIAIHDTTGLAAAIANELHSFIGGIEGYCRYTDNFPRLTKLKEEFDSIIRTPEPETSQVNDLLSCQNSKVDDYLFTKRLKFKYQNEYRLVWHCKETKDFIDVEIKNPTAFASEIIFKP